MTERVEWIEDIASLEGLRDPWERLVEDHPTPFADLDWLVAWHRAFAGGAPLQMGTVWRGDELAAALPMLRRGRALVALTDAQGSLFEPPARDGAALTAAFAAAFERGAQHVCLHGVPVGAGVLEAMRAASAPRRRLTLVEPQHTSPIVATDGDVEQWRASRQPSLRTLLRKRRKLFREHDAQFSVQSESSDLSADLARGFAVEGSGWKSAAGTAVLSSAATRGFFEEVSEALRRRGDLRLAWLHVDGRPVGFCLCAQRHRRLFLLKTGFDASLGKFAPGLLVNLCLIEHCFESGLEAYDLLGGSEPWKLQFATDAREHERIWSYALRPASLGHWAVRRVGRPVALPVQQELRRRAQRRRRVHEAGRAS